MFLGVGLDMCLPIAVCGFCPRKISRTKERYIRICSPTVASVCIGTYFRTYLLHSHIFSEITALTMLYVCRLSH